MALIKCPECEREISDKANVCPNCGCPIEKVNGDTQKVEITGVKIKNPARVKKYIIISVVVVLISALIAVIGSTIARNKAIKEAEKEAEKEKIKYEQTLETYQSNLKLAKAQMFYGAVEAEDAGNIIKKVWYNAIYEIKDASTNCYTSKGGGGKYFYDFNTALSNLFSSSSFSSEISSIKENQDFIKEIMKKLTNPPDEYKEAYEALKDLYDAYLDLTNLVIDPSGSYTTYSENFSNADARMAKCYEAMEVYIG